MTYTFGSCLTTTNAFLSMFYIASFVKSVTAVMKEHGHDTWQELWVMMVWSFLALWHGVHPLVDWNGRAFKPGSRFAAKAGQLICEGYRFVIWNIIGDWEFMANVLGMPHWRNPSVCHECDATQISGSRSYGLNFPGKLWTLFDPEVFTFLSRFAHILFSLPGVSAWCVCFDVLHCLDTKGIASKLCGSVLHQMIFEKTTRQGASDELARLW